MNFKQFAAAAVVGVLVSASAVSAKTYALTLTTTRLTPVKDSGVPGISGVTKLTVIFYSSKPFPASYYGSWPGPYNFSDGVDTLTSLTSQGFYVQDGYPLLVYYTSGPGKQITSWYIRTNMPNGTVDNYYTWLVSSNFNGDPGSAQVAFQTLEGKTTAEDNGLPASAKFSTQP